MSEIKKILLNKLGDNQILFDEPMKNHTSFKIGGLADILIMPKSSEEINFIIDACKSCNVNFFVMGNGTNLLVSDKGIRGVVIKISKNYSDVSVKENIVTAKSGVLLSSLSNTALNNSLSGIEFASGIPGTLGGAVYMNAGAYGGEIKDVLKSAEVIYGDKILNLQASELDFEYRSSRVAKEGLIVLEACLELKHGEYDLIKEEMQNLKKQRNEKQPVEFPSAGSTFKRPVGHFAGKLIMDAGLRGFAVGGAKISEKHCGFVINQGNATAEDVLELVERVKEIVYEKSGVMLEPEIRKIGE